MLFLDPLKQRSDIRFAEMDALPGVGHACGHNLIAISGVAVACAIKKAIVKHNISGTVILLGTPGESSVTLMTPSDTDCTRRGGWYGKEDHASSWSIQRHGWMRNVSSRPWTKCHEQLELQSGYPENVRQVHRSQVMALIGIMDVSRTNTIFEVRTPPSAHGRDKTHWMRQSWRITTSPFCVSSCDLMFESTELSRVKLGPQMVRISIPSFLPLNLPGQ